MQEKIRRYRHNIYISGFGVVILGFWNVVKTVLSLTATTAFSYDSSEYTPTQRIIIGILIVVIFLFFSALFFSIHLYIGSNAMKVGRGERRKKRFLIACVLLMIITFFNIPAYIVALASFQEWDTMFAAMLVDTTLIFALADILYSNNKIKKLSEHKR